MEVYLIRHTTPDIKKGMCYGQADLNTTGSFAAEAANILPHLPPHVDRVYSSPLLRCRKLAEYLFPGHSIHFEERLKEINCGEWELKLWDEIEPQNLKEWMDDFVNVSIPGGESYVQLFERVVQFFEQLPRQGTVAIVSHGGVMRSLLAYVERVALKDSFQSFSIRYGCVVRLHLADDVFRHHILHNPEAEQEQHRPSAY